MKMLARLMVVCGIAATGHAQGMMRRIAIGIILAAGCCFGQTMSTTQKGSLVPPQATFASPPSSPATGSEYTFTDAGGTGTCSGGGSSVAKCRWSGSVWQPIGSAGGVTNSGTLALGVPAAGNGTTVIKTQPTAVICTTLAGDGSTDDATALNACIAALSNNQTLLIPQPSAYYKIGSTINIHGPLGSGNSGFNAVKIVGQGGRMANLNQQNGQVAFRWSGTAGGTMFDVENCSGCTIQDFAFYSDTTNGSGTGGAAIPINVDQTAAPDYITTGFTLTGSSLYGAQQRTTFKGIVFSATSGNNVENTQITNVFVQCSTKASGGGVGQALVNTNNTNALGNVFSNFNFVNCGSSAVAMATAATFTGGLTENNVLSFALSGAHPVSIKGYVSEFDTQFATLTGPGKSIQDTTIVQVGPAGGHYGVDVNGTSTVYLQNVGFSQSGAAGDVGCPGDGGVLLDNVRFSGNSTATLTGLASCTLGGTVRSPINFVTQANLALIGGGNTCATVTPTANLVIFCNDGTIAKVSVNGAALTTLGNGTGSTNKATCWKTATTLGYCSTVVASDGSCTCN